MWIRSLGFMSLHMRNYLATVAFLAACFAMQSSARAQASDDALSLSKTTACMLKVLRTVPGVSEASLGTSTDGGWDHPFLEYRAAEGSHWVQPNRFNLQKDDKGHVWFMAMLPGVGKIDTQVTDIVVKKWKMRCDVAAVVILD
jgi:hypothetical protein